MLQDLVVAVRVYFLSLVDQDWLQLLVYGQLLLYFGVTVEDVSESHGLLVLNLGDFVLGFWRLLVDIVLIWVLILEVLDYENIVEALLGEDLREVVLLLDQVSRLLVTALEQVAVDVLVHQDLYNLLDHVLLVGSACNLVILVLFYGHVDDIDPIRLDVEGRVR